MSPVSRDNGLAELLEDIQATLRVPFVNLIFHRLESWPIYLASVWQHSRDVVRSAEFDRAADALGRLAAAPDNAMIARPAGVRPADLETVKILTNAYVYVQPRLLLLIAGWAAGPEGADCPRRHVSSTRRDVVGTCDARADVPMIDLPPADPTVAQLFERMVTNRGHPGVASYYRSLANWPQMLTACWAALEPYTTSQQYHDRAQRLPTAATTMAASVGLTGAVAPVTTSHAHDVAPLLTRWRDVQVPQLMLDTRFIKDALREVR